MADVLSLLEKRQSLRVYADLIVPEDVRHTVLNAAVSAPTAGALMLYAMIEIEDAVLKGRLAELCDNQPFIAKAPWIVLFAADYQRLEDSWLACEETPGRAFGVADLMLAVDDALIAAQTAVIAAEALGLGSCYIGDVMENAESIAELLCLPERVFPATLLCFGYPPEGFTRPKTPRLPLDAVLHRDRYERRQLPNNGYYAKQSARAHAKFHMDFSMEMNRSVEHWIERWRRGN